MTGRLLLCATPIGNLSDVSPRLIDALRAADVIFAEDTRRTGNLLAHLGVESPELVSFFVGNEHERLAVLQRRLEAGDTVALVTDAGTPSISDPGLLAVRRAREVEASIEAIPGPSAVTTALTLSGLPADRFAFDGFLPRKGADRTSRLAELAAERRTTVLFASPRRLVADLEDIRAAVGGDRTVAVCRELTKLHEEVWVGSLDEAVDVWGERTVKGEVTLVVEGRPEGAAPSADAVTPILEILARADVSTRDAARAVAEATGMSRNDAYDVLNRLRKQ